MESMNREMKRRLQRQGQLGPDGAPPLARKQPPRPTPKPVRERTGARQFLREVRGELRKVAWPTRPEVINYATVVLITLVLLVVLIFFLDLGFAKTVLFLFE